MSLDLGFDREAYLEKQRAARRREEQQPITPADRDAERRGDALDPPFPYVVDPFPLDFLESDS